MENNIIYELAAAVATRRCVLFAGAGISTEGGIYGTPTFYSSLKKECDIKKKEEPSFPELMQIYCDKFDGPLSI